MGEVEQKDEPPKVNEYEYVNFLIATQQAYSCTKAKQVQPESENTAAHDAITQLLDRMEPSPIAL